MTVTVMGQADRANIVICDSSFFSDDNKAKFDFKNTNNLEMNNQVSSEWDDFYNDIKSSDIRVDVLQLEIKEAKVAEVKIEDPPTIQSHRSCTECNVPYRIEGSRFICVQCGKDPEIEVDTDNSSLVTKNDSNTSNSGYMPFSFTGQGSYGFQRAMLKTCARYEEYRKNKTMKELSNFNYQTNGKKIPKDVLRLANELFDSIKKHRHVFRTNIKKGVMSACLYYACYMKHISKTPNEIAALMGIEEKFHSIGDRKVRSLAEKGIIQIPTKIDPTLDYVVRYMQILDISLKYKDFVIDIINRAERAKLHIKYDSRTNTKAVGGIYLLIERIPELRKRINKDKIEKECKISKTTFTRYYMIINNYYRKFKKIFKFHKIKMPRRWKA